MWKTFSKRQWATIVVVASSHFGSAICSSLQAPFYPLEAEQKGASATEYGLVFGTFYLTVFLLSPLFGQYLNYLGSKFVFTASNFIVATCTALFGALDVVDNHFAFIGLSFAIRILEAVGNAGYLTASFAYLAAEFPETVATVFASLETFYGLGLIAGPAIGAALYQLGGFYLPFVVFGGIQGIEVVLTFFLLPYHEPTAAEQRDAFLLVKIIRIPGVFLAACAILVSAISTGFVTATLEPHLRQFNLSHVHMGSVFMIEGGTYALTAPIWGRICDRLETPEVIIIFGSMFTLLGFVFIGPLPIIPTNTILWLSCLSLLLNGLGSGGLLVAGFLSGLTTALKSGYPPDLTTYGTVSGLWSSAFALGCFVGPSVAGYLFDHVGFRKATWFCVGCQVVLITMMTSYLSIRSWNRRKSLKQPDLFSEKVASTELTESTNLLRGIPRLRDTEKNSHQL